MADMKKILSKHGSVILLSILVVFVVASNWYWIHADQSLGIDVDSKDYIIKTITQLDELRIKGFSISLSGWLAQISREGRPPLYQILSMPFILLFGRSMDSGLILNLVFWALLIAFIYLAGKTAGNAGTGLLASVFVASYPPLIQASRLFRPHFALAACTALILWRALALLGRRSSWNVWWFMLSLTFGALIHPKIAGVLLIPAPLFSLYVVFFQDAPYVPSSVREFPKWAWAKLSDPIVRNGFLPAIVLAALPILAWYLSIGSSAFGAFKRITSESVADFRGYEIYKAGFKNYPSSLWYLLSMPYALSNILTLFFGVGFVYLIVKRSSSHFMMLMFFLGAYIVYASYKTLAWLNFIPVLPIVALISAVWVGEIKNKKIAWTLVSLIAASSLMVFSIVNWGAGGLGIKVARMLSSPVTRKGSCPLGNMVFCPSPPDQRDWRSVHAHMLETIISDPDCRIRECNVLALQMADAISSNTLNYYRQIEFEKSPLVIVAIRGTAFKIVPFNFSAFLNSPFIIFADKQERAGIYGNAIGKLFNNPPKSFVLSHRIIKIFKLPDNRKLYLLKRTAPLTLSEAQDVIRLIDLDDKYKFGQYRVLAPLYAQAGQYENALEAYQQALIYEPGDAKLYFGLAGVYESLGQLQDSASAYRKVIELAPGTDLARQAESWLSAH